MRALFTRSWVAFDIRRNDFHGFTGLAYISGMVVRTNRRTHETVELPFHRTLLDLAP